MLPVLLLSVLFFSCDRQPFVEHKIKSEKLNTTCANLSGSFKVTANFGGERFEFDKCLPSDFNEDDVTAMRKGDTVLINFPKANGKSTAGYKIILDIDSYPTYRVVTIDDESYNISVTGN
jgi:hypothetical protein